MKGQRSTTQMSVFLIDEKLITDKSDIRDMWADHFEDLGKPNLQLALSGKPNLQLALSGKPNLQLALSGKPNLQLAVCLIMTFPTELPIVSGIFLYRVKTNCPVP